MKTSVIDGDWQELNKKLAEWQWGKVYWWEELKNVRYRPIALYIGYYYVKQKIGNERYMPVPDFTDPDYGIAFCFKWLVPDNCSIQLVSREGCTRCILSLDKRKEQRG